jgi:hypothetical protein
MARHAWPSEDLATSIWGSLGKMHEGQSRHRLARAHRFLYVSWCYRAKTMRFHDGPVRRALIFAATATICNCQRQGEEMHYADGKRLACSWAICNQELCLSARITSPGSHCRIVRLAVGRDGATCGQQRISAGKTFT